MLPMWGWIASAMQIIAPRPGSKLGYLTTDSIARW
jgi:hypothetical protein